MMRLEIRVRPRARRHGVETATDGTLIVDVTEPAQDGRANATVVDTLADYFRVPKRAVTIVRGLASRRKLIEILP